MRPGRCPAHRRARRHVLEHGRTGDDACSRADRQVAGHSDLAGQPRPVPDPGTSRDSDLRHEHAIFADLNVVAHMYEVVELCARTDDRVAQRAAIDRAVRSDLDIVSDCASSDLRNLHGSGGAGGVSEAFRAQAHPFVDDDPVADDGVRENRCRVTDLAIGSEPDVPAQQNTRFQFAAVTDANVVSDHDVLADPNVVSEHDAASDHRGGMDAGFPPPGGAKQIESLSERDLWIRDAQEGHIEVGEDDAAPDEKRPRMGGLEAGQQRFSLEERKLIKTGHAERRNAPDLPLSVSLDARIDIPGDVIGRI